MSGRYKKMI